MFGGKDIMAHFARNIYRIIKNEREILSYHFYPYLFGLGLFLDFYLQGIAVFFCPLAYDLLF